VEHEQQHNTRAVYETVAVLIPALNEAESLPLVLRDLPQVGLVVVVDNGSTDDTARLATELGATVIREPQRGYGKACLSGLAEVQRQSDQEDVNVEVIVFADADYSDHVHAIGNLIEPIVADQQDFVLGSRLLGEREPGAMPPQSVYGNKFACWLMRLILGKNCYTDLGPLRAIRYTSLKRLAMVDENFGWTIEMQIKAIKHGLRTIEVPVPYRRRIGVSKISGTISGTFRAGTKIIYSVWKYGRA
jgi:glycosyltransferase involved in cell wall biosynthesis